MISARLEPRFKRGLARLAILLVLCAVPVAATGCGAGAHLAENVLGHKLANHFAHTPGQRRLVNRAFCLLSVEQAYRDFKHHHLVYGAATVAVAIRDCERGFARHAR